MNECANSDVRDQLPMLAQGTISTAARAEVAEHLARCAACAHELELVTEAHAALRLGAAVDVVRIATAVQRGALQGTRPRQFPVRRAVPWALAAAAAIVLIAGGVPDKESGDDPSTAAAAFTLDAELALASDAELEALLAELDDIPATLGAEPEAALTLDLDNGETP